MANLGFSIRQDELPENENTGFDPIPAGVYPVTIEGCEIKDTKSGGKMLSFKLKVTGDKFTNRVLWPNVNIVNSNPTAQNIGLGQLKDIMRAVGVGELNDTDQFIGGNMNVVVKVKPEANGYPASNEIAAFKPASAVATSSPSFGSAPAAPAGGSTPPWMK